MSKANEMAERLAEVHTKYADALMKKKHVVGVSVGRSNQNPSEVVLIVLVDEHVPNDQLSNADRIPEQIEGVKVEVRENGMFEAY